MADKQEKLNMKQALENMEEFFIQLSFNGRYECIKILKVETVDEAVITDQSHPMTNVICLQERRQSLDCTDFANKSLRHYG